ncbi:uncharacterized protein LOC106674361 [Cimex lectularius]|uniref:CPR type cuticle protein n=1 Tax=Cimex lectularius TaxID=79782 RepID=A0A8I6SF38_CIMLE|nr:uncharacterized protein LOC106674361 [Cimex lectularius]
MNFIKLIPILFLAHSPVGDARPVEPQVLPAVPGYIPVYIQTGNTPPDIEALYKSVVLSPPKRETSPRKDFAEGFQQEVEPVPMKLEVPEKLEVTKEKEDEVMKEEPKKEVELVETSPVEKNQTPQNKDEQTHKAKEETRKAIGQIREIPQYEVKEPKQE